MAEPKLTATMEEDRENWIDELTTVRLPALDYNKKRVERSFQRASAAEPGLSQILGQDPGLLLRLYQELLESDQGSAPLPIDPVHIISRLGNERIRVLVRAMPTLEERYLGNALKGLKLSYTRALHSAAFAHKLGTLQGKSNSGEYAAVSLLQNLGEAALWARKPGTMNMLWGGLKRPEDLDFKCCKRFGVSPTELGEALARRWELPPQVVKAQRPHNSFDPNAQLPLLAASLSWAVINDWQSEETVQLMELAADLIHLDPDMVRVQILRVAAETARTAYAMGLTQGSERLLLPLQQDADDADQASSATPAPSSPVRPQAQELKTDQLASHGIQMHSTDPQSNADNLPPRAVALMQRLDGILQKMRDESGLERIMFAMLTADMEQLRARFVLERTRTDIDRFSVSVQSRNLFGMMMRQPRTHWIHPGNRKKFLSFAPEQTTRLLHPDAFFVASILAGHRPIGLLYADASSLPLNQERFDGFKTQCQSIARLFGDGKKQ